MSDIYLKVAGDQTLLMTPRTGFLRKFNVGTDWTELRVGMYASTVGLATGNTSPVAETVVVSNALDRITFGLKDDSQNLPGQAGSLFLGMRAVGNSLSASNFFECINGSGQMVGCTCDGTVFTDHVTVRTHPLGEADATAASAYCGFNGLKFLITDRGLATQKVTIHTTYQAVVPTTYGVNNLRTLLNNATYSTFGAGTLDWNTGVVAKAIPDCFWVYTGLFNNRLRISAIRGIKYA